MMDLSMVRTLGFMLLCLLLASCDKQADQAIRRAELLMQDEPDSALHLLQGVDRRTLSGERLARYALVYSIAQHKSRIDVANDSLLRIAYNYYSRHPEDSLYARSQFYMGIYYIMVDSTKQGEDCLRTAARCAEERGEYYTLYLALNKLAKGIRYSDASLALEYSKKAFQVYSEHCPPNITNKILLLKDIGDAYLLCNKEDSALYYMDLALEEAMATGDSTLIGAVLQDKSLLYTKLDDYSQALSMAKMAWDISPARNINLATRLASCYADADSARQARELYAAITRVGDYGQKYLAYKDLATLAAKDNDKTSFIAYSDSSYKYMEEMYKQILKTKSDYYQDLIRLEKEKERADYRLKLRTRLFLVSVVSFLLLAILVFWNLYLRIRIHKQKRQYLEKEREVLAQKMQQKEAMVRFLQNYIVERIDIIQEINKNKDSHVLLSKKDWFDIEQILNEIDNQSISKVRAEKPNFTEDDIRLCMLVRLRLSNSAIGNIYGISASAVQHRKLKLKKDGFGETRPDITLEQAIVSI